MSVSGRLYGLDVLRGVAMILGIVLHATIAYKAGYHHGEWVFDKANTSWLFDWLFLVINSFRMQLFFLLAGFFAALLIYKRGLRAFTVNRFKRIGLPFFIAYFTILPLTLLPYQYVQFEKTGDPIPQLKQFFIDFFTFRAHSGVMHMWFLQQLLVFCAGAVVMVFLYRKFNLAERLSGIVSRFKSTEVSYWSFVLTAIAGTGAISLLFHAALPFIWTGFVIPAPQLLYYGLFFILGWVVFERQSLLAAFSRNAPKAVAVALALSLVTVYLLNQGQESLSSLKYVWALKFIFGAQTVFFIVGAIGFFNKAFESVNAFWKYIADAAYWVYLIHMPVVMATQLLLRDSEIPGPLRFPIVIVSGIIVSFGTYHLFVRYSWIGQLLNGKRAHKERLTNSALLEVQKNV
jgi:glucans biosynthesis protein C